jgi:hypothetical protein
MSSVKCPNCGLVNFATEAKCKRCGLSQEEMLAPGSQTRGSVQVSADGYVFPPAPNSGYVWQKNGVLIFNRQAFLPDRCVKCNLPTGGLGVTRKLSWHHPVIYLALLGGFLLYIILAVVLSKGAIVLIGLCDDHRRKRRHGMLIGWLLFGGGFVGAILGIASDYIGFMIVCLLLIPVGLVWLITAARIVKIKKIDDQFIWLTGINREYLGMLPPSPW